MLFFAGSSYLLSELKINLQAFFRVTVNYKEIMNIDKSDFGKLANGAPAFLFTLSNGKGAEVDISNYGGIVVAVRVPDKSGKIEDVVLGFSSVEGYYADEYLKEGPYFGAVIGRFGNRIANGKFSLNGTEYTLAANNGPNHLHGGLKGFDKVLWEAEELNTGSEVGVKLTYLSKDMEEGYPGNLSVEVTYLLTGENELKIEYKATTDKATIVNLTNHSYFNLAGNAKGDVLGHEVMVNADSFVPVDDTLIPLGGLQEVAGSAFDFRSPRTLGEGIEADDRQIKNGHGYDHCWVTGKEGEMKLAATAYELGSGRLLEVYTTEPGVQVYTANFLTGKLTGKEGVPYKRRYGLCFETEHFPDSPNRPDFPSVELKPGEEYNTKTTFKFAVK